MLLFSMMVSCGPSQPRSAENGEMAYLFCYFTNKNENKNGMHLAWSKDGYQWTAIGPERGFLLPDTINPENGGRMRDPFVMKGPDGLYHCLWTTAWESDRIGYASSEDFITWSEQSFPRVMDGYEVRNCWAPEMIYDEQNKQYIIFWASTIKVDGEWKTEEGKKYDHRMYYTTTRDFRTYAPAKVFFDPGHNVIDATIQKAGGRYYMIYKDETEIPQPQKNFLVAVAERAEGPYIPTGDKPFTRDWVEGPAVCPLSEDHYLVYMDAYRDKHYEAMITRDFTSWENVTDKISVPSGARHGSFVIVPMSMVDKLIGN